MDNVLTPKKQTAYGTSKHKKALQNIKRYSPLYFIALPSILWYIIFCYLPMFGVIIAFKEYYPFSGIEGIFTSDFVGFKYFQKFLTSTFFWRALRNNVIISLMSFSLSYPLSIILALLLNELVFLKFKKVVQTISYLPHFLSVMVIVSIISVLTDQNGPINFLLIRMGLDPIYFLVEKEYFRWIIAISDCWQSVGWGSIIFLAALTSIDQELYTAAAIDGATRFQRVKHISIPGMYDIVSITLILNVPALLGASFEKILLLMNTNTQEVGDVLSTYIYRVGLVEQEYSYSSAVGLFTSILAVILLLSANKIAHKLGREGIW